MFVWKDGRRRDPLPIDDYLPEILRRSAESQVVIVEAETGAGKTIRIGQAATLEDPGQKVRLTSPRRAPVRWNGRRIAEELGVRPGGLVGWYLSREKAVLSRATRLRLQVDQALSNEIRQHNRRLPEGLIIIDEAHERSTPIDLLAWLVKTGLSGSPQTRVVITSATIDTQKFSAYFGGAPVVKVPGRCFPVRTEIVRLNQGEHHSQGAARAAKLVMSRFLAGELLIPTADGQGAQVVAGGTVIILLPGKEDISQVAGGLREWIKEQEATERFEIVTCHGESAPEEQDAVQRPLRPGTLRFVVGTEILRSSVTVRNTVGLIDSLQVKRLITNPQGVAHLAKVAISRAEAIQGAGRPGRTGPGFYMPISFGSEYENLAPYPTPAILVEPLTHVALQVAAVGASMREVEFIDAPDPERVEVALARLKRLGALDEAERITDVGRLLLQFPLDPERAKALITADTLGILPETVVAAAILEAEGIFFRPKESQEPLLVDEALLRLILAHSEERYGRWETTEKPCPSEEVSLEELPGWATRQGELYQVSFEYEARFPSPHGRRWIGDLVRRHWAGSSRSDFVAMVRAYRAFKAEERRLREAVRARRLSGRQADQALYAWCDRWSVNLKRLRLAEDVMAEIRADLEGSPLRLTNGLSGEREFDAAALTKALASGLTDHVARLTGYRYEGPLGDFELAHQSACSSSSPLILVGGVHKIPIRGRRGATSFIDLADLAAPVKPEWLVEVMPQLCSRQRQGDYSYWSSEDRVVETEAIRFVDLEIGRESVTAADDGAAARTFCAWLAAQMVS